MKEENASSETTELPPSLAVSPNIAMEHQTVEQLRAERDYWIEQVRTATGWSSAKAADDFRKGCEAWIKRRERERLQLI